MIPMVSASEAMAYGALAAGVQLVTGYPGSPSTEAFEALLRLAPATLRIEWATNEKSAFDIAFGASLAGLRTLLCLKGVGLNVALDSLMVGNLAPGTGGFVILTGDDPGGWGSQNEEDSRLLAVAAEVPLLEPTFSAEAGAVMFQAFDLSERFQVPVVVRITRALAAEHTPSATATSSFASDWPRMEADSVPRIPFFPREPDRYNVLPIHVVKMHTRLQETLRHIRLEFEQTSMNGLQGYGSVAVIAAGHAYQKLVGVLAQSGRPAHRQPGATQGGPPPLRILRLGTLFPLPERLVLSFLHQADQILVLEELAPYVEIQVQAIAQRAGLHMPIAGRCSGPVPGAGELSAMNIIHALAQLLPAWPWPTLRDDPRAMPSRQPLCNDCPYRPTFESLLAVMQSQGGRSAFIVTGETGCMVRAQLPPWKMLDVKYAMGSSIGLATGLSLAGPSERIIALSGDSALLHSGLAELIDAVQARARLLVVVLANQTTALSGGQPHPATAHDARGNPRQPIDLAALIHAAGVGFVRTLDPVDVQAMQTALQEGLAAQGPAVVIAQHACPLFTCP